MLSPRAPQHARKPITTHGIGSHQDLTKAAAPFMPLLALFDRMKAEHTAEVPAISQADRDIARERYSVLKIYMVYLQEFRDQQCRDGKLRRGTIEKDRQSLRCFSKWDHDPIRAPKDWPEDEVWQGLPALYLAQGYVEQWFLERILQGYSINTMRSRWAHLRTIMNMVQRLGIMDVVPTVEVESVIRRIESSTGIDPDDDLPPVIYSTEQLDQVYRRIEEFDLLTAWVLGLNCGARTVDLFSLRWGHDVRFGEKPEVTFKARKTGRRHWVPLHPVTVQHLRKLVLNQGHINPAKPTGLVFPDLTSAVSKDPEKSPPARIRNDRIKAAIRAAGIGLEIEGEYDKPWQVLRATCSTRLNNHRPGIGRLVTHGKESDVNSLHYWNEYPAIVEAINTLVLPPAFNVGGYKCN